MHQKSKREVILIKPLLPTLKERKRYILFRLFTEERAENREVKELVTKAGLTFLGELGMAKSGFQFMPETWKQTEMTGIVKVGHKFVDEAKSALILIKQFKGKPASISCLKVSGVINKVK